MKTATAVSIRMPVLLLLLLQSIPVKAMNAGMSLALPEAKSGAAYEFTIRTEGGQPPFKWSVVEGALPPGIELDQSGVLRGTPAAPRPQAYEFTLQVSDSSEPPQTYSQRFALTVKPAPLRMVIDQPTLRIIDPKLSSQTIGEAATARPASDSRVENIKSRIASNGSKDGEAANKKPATDPATTKTSDASDVVKVCGKLRPASLDRVFTFVGSVPELRSLMPKINGGRFSNDETCEELGRDKYKPGTQKELEVRLLEFVLTALQDETQEASDLGLKTAIANMDKSFGEETNDEKTRPLAPEEWKDAVKHLKWIKQNSFDRLSERTIEKQIQFLNRDLGSINVQVKKGDKVVATAQTDKDGNYIAKIPKENTDQLAKTDGGDKNYNAGENGRATKRDRGGNGHEKGASKKTRANDGHSNTGDATHGDGNRGGGPNAYANSGQNTNGDVKNDDAKSAADKPGSGSDRDAKKEKSKANDTSEYLISTEADDYHTERSFVLGSEDVRVDIPIEDRPVSLLTRAVVGYQQAAAASSSFEQNYFFDMYIRSSLPVPQKIDPDFGEKFQLWGAVRVASVPQPGTATIGNTVSGDFIAQVKGLKLNEAARVFDMLSGFEYRLVGNSALLPSFASDTKQKFSLSLIGSFGLVTPTTPEQSVRKFEISDELRKLFPPDQLKDKDFVAFVNNDRDRFFKQLYAGLRVQTFFFNRHNVPMQRFPAQLDVQFGLNSYVTGGRTNQGVLRLDGYYPLPYDKLKFINLYGTAIIRPAHARIQTPLILKQPAQDFDVPGPRVAIIPVSQFNRDYYKVGVGIDFMSLIQKMTGK